MAHYKRRRPRTRSAHNCRGNCNTYWLSHWPRWWDIEFHTRPRRRKNREAEGKVMRGFDPDGLLWPVEKKPHKYYW